MVKDKPIDPDSVERYLQQKFGDDLACVREAMVYLAAPFSTEDLAANSYALYERFRPQIPSGTRGWGAKGKLDLRFVRSLTGTT